MTFKPSKELKVVVSEEVDGKTISLESGWVAKQAGGAVIARQGDTMVLCTVCSADPRPGQSFFPLTVEYQEKTYSAGKIPGGFFKREARPGENEILTCRIIDRPIRPMFPKGYMDEVQIICTVISADHENSPDMLALTGASAALSISSLPFAGPVSGVRVGRKDGKFFVNGTPADYAESDIDLVVAGTSDAIAMVEAGAKMVAEADMLDALDYGHTQIKKINELQLQLQKKVGKEKVEYVAKETSAELEVKVISLLGKKVVEALAIREKQARNATLSEIKSDIIAALAEEFPEQEGAIKDIISSQSKKAARLQTVNERVRIDGRELTTVRPIECEVDLLPRAHGSALFTRGETQSIVTTTLGTGDDAQMIDGLSGKTDRYFMLHYNFPPYCTGEAKMMRGTSRREVGHGALAYRAIEQVLPDQKDFPYVVRVVSDVTESNGSSSMATVCGGSMSLAAAGVGIKDMVGGVAMGLIKEGDKYAILTDILGDEDHFGDMDFKVCGTKDGITALQMDIKCDGLTREIMEQALEQARQARLHILGEMSKAIETPRTELSKYAPQIRSIKVSPDKIRDIIGSGGKTIRSICESTGTKIDIQDDGTVKIAAPDGDAIARAIEIIEGLTAEAEIGKIYTGIVKKIVDFGAFVEILPGTEGLLHISQIAKERVESVSDILTEGEQVPVRVLDIDRSGKIRLSRKEAMDAMEDAAS